MRSSAKLNKLSFARFKILNSKCKFYDSMDNGVDVPEVNNGIFKRKILTISTIHFF